MAPWEEGEKEEAKKSCSHIFKKYYRAMLDAHNYIHSQNLRFYRAILDAFIIAKPEVSLQYYNFVFLMSIYHTIELVLH